MKKILVPTDLSLTAENALQYAIQIALQEKAKIVLVHAFKIDTLFTRGAFSTYFIQEEIEYTERRANRSLSNTCDWIKEEHALECDYVTMMGEPIDVIKRTARQLKPHMIVMGTNGASGFTDKLLGSTTARTIGNVKCPVIVVPAAAKYHGIKRIVFTLDFSQRDAVTIKKIQQLITLFPANISLLHIDDGTKTNAQTVVRQFKNKAAKKLGLNNISCRTIRGFDVQEQLLKIAKSKRYDLLVMTMHHRSFLQSVFNRSITKKVTNSIKIPLLIFNDSYANRK